MVLWPIIEPLVPSIKEIAQDKFKEEVRILFFDSIQNPQTIKERNGFIKLPPYLDASIKEFITELIKDFSLSFYEDLLEGKSKQQIIKSLNLLIYQQIVLSWINYVVDKSITPLIILAVKSSRQIEEIKEFIARLLLAIAQDTVQYEEAKNQILFTFKNEYKLSEELTLFINAFIKTFANFKEKHGLEELAKIGEFSINQQKQTKSRIDLVKTVQDPIYDRDKIVNEWIQNILKPATIGLLIAGTDEYKTFIGKCQKHFELFLDKILTSDDFEKRLEEELLEFGGDDEELIKPIRETITNSVRFLELARIDDPSLSLLIAIIDEEREGTKRTCL
jgi:hypothetical protein